MPNDESPCRNLRENFKWPSSVKIGAVDGCVQSISFLFIPKFSNGVCRPKTARRIIGLGGQGFRLEIRKGSVTFLHDEFLSQTTSLLFVAPTVQGDRRSCRDGTDKRRYVSGEVARKKMCEICPGLFAVVFFVCSAVLFCTAEGPPNWELHC